jgi:riboflavin kinase/FMN adenylyltransferase
MKTLRGIVRHGDKRGKKLGYPTANVWMHQDTRDGVYVSLIRVRDVWYPSMTFIGAAKTFGKKQRLLETHIFDFDMQIYGEWVSVQLHKYVRGNKKFDSVTELLRAMKKDEQQARAYFDH